MVKTYPFAALGSEAVVNDRVADVPLVVVYYAEAGFAVPFSRKTVDTGQTLTMERVGSAGSTYPFMMRDRETGSTWNLKGRAVDGPLEGAQLAQLPSHNGFWFAWGTFWQNMGIY
jgi:hypothetical protein